LLHNLLAHRYSFSSFSALSTACNVDLTLDQAETESMATLKLQTRIDLLKLVFSNMRESVFPTILIVVPLSWALSNKNNMQALTAWCVTQIILQLFLLWELPRLLALDLTQQRVNRIVVWLTVMLAVHGLVWGALAWITLDTSSPVESILVIAVLLAIPGASTLAMAPLFPAFAAFCVVEILTLGSRLWQQPEQTFQVLVVLTGVSLLGFLGQGFKAFVVSRESFELRDENRELVALLSLEKAHAQAEHARADLANMAKSKFLAAASHDLRQPIFAQGLFLDVLSRTPLSAHQTELVMSARSASLASSDMLNTLLDFSRIEAGITAHTRQPFALQPLLHKIENDLAPLADAINLVYRCRETQVVVDSDASLVEMVLRNLVSNAIRYTERGGILVACRSRGEEVVVEVWDTGIGIAPEHQQDIFREFHQLGNPERDRNKGLGLGLAIAEAWAKVLGHGLSLSSKPGRGSVFRFTLPRYTGTLMPVDVAPSPQSMGLAGIRILVIDDDEVVRSAMRYLLQSWGGDCLCAASLGDAIAIAQRYPPALIISDFRLKGAVTGAHAIAAIRGMLATRTPALLVTGDTDPARLKEAFSSGTALLHKPLAADLLYQAIQKALADQP
jgi:signal transduction histidine kinase/CheY-like chemotaxis protein